MTIPFNFQIEGCTGRFSSEINGYLFTRTLKLFDVVAKTKGDDADIHQAFSALVDNFVPNVGNDLSHIDSDLTGCWLREIAVSPLGNNQWRVVLEYQHSPFNTTIGVIKVSSGTQVSQVESNIDRNGKSIELVYQYPEDYGGDKPTEREVSLRGTFSGRQGGTFSKLIPGSTRIYTLREDRDPLVLKNLVGVINESDWLTTGDALHWMLTDINGDTDDSQQSPRLWVNSYTFQHKKDDWQEEVVFTDSNTNEPVPDPVFTYADFPDPNIGSKAEVLAYDQASFKKLFPEFT